MERTGTPFLKGKAPDRVDADGKSYADHLSEKLAQAAQNATIALPEGWEAEFMSAAQTGSTFDQFEVAVTKRIQKLILGQTLTSDVGSSGSFAAAKVHEGVREDRRNADMRLVVGSVQTLINALHTLNGFSGQPPVFIMEDEQGLNRDRAERDAVLVNAGILKLSEDYILRTFDYEKGEISIPVKSTLEQTVSAPLPGETFAVGGDPFTPDQMAIEHLADAMLANMSSPIKAAAIESAVRAATDPEDLERRLALVLKDADITEFSQQLERCLFAADVMGYANAQ